MNSANQINQVHGRSPPPINKRGKKRVSLAEAMTKGGFPSPPFSCSRPSKRNSALASILGRTYQRYLECYDIKATKQTRSMSLLHNNSSHLTSPEDSGVTHKNIKSKYCASTQERRTTVSNLPWTDSQGSYAEYTGQVSQLMQPDGFGYLVYNDGTVFGSIWCNGVPLRLEPKKKASI